MKIRVSAVSYLNTKPFLRGLMAASGENRCDVSLDTPAECARRFAEGEVQVGLVPVSAFAQQPGAEIISPWCIASLGPVKSVVVYSEVPLADISELYLDFQSRTSVELCKLLLREHWQHGCALLEAAPGYEQQIKGRRAGLVIGDRAILLRNRFPHVFDLGKAWTAWTGLPFVYACWVANTPLPREWVKAFNSALERGVADAAAVAEEYRDAFPGFDVARYLGSDVRFHFGEAERKGLELFLSLTTSRQAASAAAGR